MSDIAVENYKKAVASAFDRWARKVEPVAAQIEKINKPLKELKQNKSPSPEDKKKIETLENARNELEKKLDKFGTELKLDLSLLDMPQKGKADEKEILKLPGWLKDIVKKKGVSIGSVTVIPDVDIDFKALKIKKAAVIVEFEF